MVNSCFDGHEFIVHSWAKLVLWILQTGGFFIFIFLKTFFTEIYFQFHILQFYTPTARQGGGSDLHVNKPGRGAAGSPKYKS